MSYKSLYRKYRPQNFDDVSGQSFIIRTLECAIEQNKISHAYLFTGTRGTGKTTIAKIFAKLVNCTNMKNNKPCGKCEICTNTNTDEIPDIIEIDAASNNGVDEIRELKNKIKLVPVSCKYKVYIIDEVHMLSPGAFNALLKTLEEPPEHVIFILATTEQQKIPVTIISRCQRFDFKKISVEDIISRLKYISKEENIEIENSALEEIAKMCDGAMRDAIGTLDQLASYSTNKITADDIYMIKGSVSPKQIIKIIELYINKNTIELLDEIDDIYTNGKDFSKLVEDMLITFKNILIYKEAPKYFDKKDFLNKEKIKEISPSVSLEELSIIMLKLEELCKNIKLSNYPRILFEICMLNNCQPKEVTGNNTKAKKDENVKPLEQINNIIEDKIIKEEKKSEEEIIKTKEENQKENINNLVVEKVLKEEIPVIISSKTTLINNTIALASAKNKKEVAEIFSKIDEYLIDKKFKDAATILKDAKVAAASSDHILLTYKYTSMVEDNDNEINNIINLFERISEIKYKIVAITLEEWEKQRPYYLDLKKKNGNIDLIEEKEIKEEKKNKKNNTAIDEVVDIFGSDIVEMEG